MLIGGNVVRGVEYEANETRTQKFPNFNELVVWGGGAQIFLRFSEKSRRKKEKEERRRRREN